MKLSRFLLLLIAVLLTFSLPQTQGAQAQAGKIPEGDLIPAQKSINTPDAALDHETHPALHMSPDKSELIRLPRAATSVVIGNPAHIAVLLDTPRLAVVVPRQPGATYFSVLDEDGDVIMQRHVLVAAPKKNYVRIRRSCGNSEDCRPTSVYFCPDMCHEIDGSAGQD